MNTLGQCELPTCMQPVFGETTFDNRWCPGHRDEDLTFTFTVTRREAAQFGRFLGEESFAFDLYLDLEKEVGGYE